MRSEPLISFTVLALAAMSSTGCLHQKSMGRDEVRSAIRSALSSAAESEMLVDFVLQGRATSSYAEGHAAYLQEEVRQSAKEFENAVAQPDAKDAFENCRTQLNAMVVELSLIRSAISDRGQLRAAMAKLTEIRRSLERLNSHP